MQQHTLAGSFLSCDWGTSSFRLKLFDPVHDITIAEEISEEGCAAIFNKWQSEGNGMNRSAYYLLYLKEMLMKLSQKTGLTLIDRNIAISGMASSSIGMQELPYANLPFPADGSGSVGCWISGKEIIHNKVLLISGAASHKDLMRGEETQLTGIIKMTKSQRDTAGIYIFPGTHSKHLTVSNGLVIDIKTFMTGELFGLLIRHGLLAGSVTVQQGDKMGTEAMAAFHGGIKVALHADLLQNLFSVRVKDLKKYHSKTLNYFYLSGLLIGAELKHVGNNRNVRYTICGAHTLGRLYHEAFRFCGLSDQVTLLAKGLSDNAAAAGQSVILKNIKPIN